MRTPLVAGNWKMNGTKASIKALVQGLKSAVSADSSREMAVCPPHVYVGLVAELVGESAIKCGSQDVCEQPEGGAFTGETAGFMLRDLGCHYAIVGHSERRTLYGEDDATVAEKFASAQLAGLIPILCVGETLRERERGITEEVVGRQLDAVIQSTSGIQAFAKAVVAYEPVWAIGTGKTASPEQAQEVHQYIRSRLAENDAGIAEGVRILYGGSVKGANAQSLFTMQDIDGGLIGGASLNAEEFLSIYAAAG